ncbi:MAG: hypothetical protein A2787_01735 [Omnitrophica WOR_2 bacterium RIFCSPHIGHO2_01_FULL_48_9]|nr:MAG: hypothetical protein A2787_01735 [Omnitrophica WOR_2 bacterium RIFCSPHIGHO2_01_FULL_48_9]
MGPNGAGKSTILKLLSKIMYPTKGEIKINGRLSALIEVTAGFHPELTGRENVYLNGTILGMRRREIDKKFDEIVEFSGVAPFIDTPVKRYSSGMYSRLGFSVAAHMDPEILLVDEVLSVGDMAFHAKCAQKMRELMASGATIVLVSHDMSLIQSLCKRTILLEGGAMAKDGPTEKVVPYYKELMNDAQEEELKRKVLNQGGRVKVVEQPLISITDLSLNCNDSIRNKFFIGEKITMDIYFEAHEKIDQPIFILEVLRSDGVLCFSSRSDQNKLSLNSVQGKGMIFVNLGKINLAPGVYLVKVSIWDKDLIHPYVIRNQDVFTLEKHNWRGMAGEVFLPEIGWEFHENK